MKNRYMMFRRFAKGSVAVEMAIILPILLLFLSVPLFYARVFWYYSVAQKAAHDAARYISSVTQAQMRTSASVFGEAPVVAVGRWIAQQELIELGTVVDSIPIDIICEPVACGTTNVPTTVRVRVSIVLHDNLLEEMTEQYIGNTNMTLTGDVTMRYAAK